MQDHVAHEDAKSCGMESDGRSGECAAGAESRGVSRFLCRWTCALWLTFAGTAWADGQDVIFETVPPGATVSQVDGRSTRPLGRSGETVRIDLPADDNVRLVFRFELDGYEPNTVTVPVFGIRHVDRYPPAPLPALKLRAASTWVALLAWGRAHAWMGGVVAGLVVVSALAFLRYRRRVGAARDDLAEAAVAAPTDRSSTTLGGWVLARPLGRGATSEVYAGFRLDAPDDPEVAIKVLRFADIPENANARARFEREAEILSRLRHPGIVGFVDWGRDGDVMFLVEELAEGTLDIPPGGLSHAAFLGGFVPVVEAVAHAHEEGVVHRDLKPDNILLDGRGHVKVADFGLAHLEGGGTTRHGAGTPLYMAPELLAGHPASPLSDQYALGVMAWQMLCGHPPHDGSSVGELMRQRQSPPPPLQTAHVLPAGLQAVVAKMMAAQPGERYPDLRAVLRDLDSCRSV